MQWVFFFQVLSNAKIKIHSKKCGCLYSKAKVDGGKKMALTGMCDT